MAVSVIHAFVSALPDNPADSAAGKIVQSHWNAAHTVANALDKTGDTMTGTLTHAVGTITASTPAIDITQTWNNAGVTFSALRINVTKTAAANGSVLFDCVSTGAYGFAVIDHGNGFTGLGRNGDTSGTLGFGNVGNFYLFSSGAAVTGMWAGANAASQLRLDSKGTFCWTQTQNDASDTRDTGLSRNAAGVVEVNNATLGTYRDLLARNVITPGVTVASLAGAAQGARSFVTDATQTLTAGIGAVVAGGGANAVPVVYDGTNWRIG